MHVHYFNYLVGILQILIETGSGSEVSKSVAAAAVSRVDCDGIRISVVIAGEAFEDVRAREAFIAVQGVDGLCGCS